MKRESFIDIARAFAIISIVIGHTVVHSDQLGQLYKFIYSFHVPLFFIISGYVFSTKDCFKMFIKKKMFRILFPYFIWAFLYLIPYVIFGQGVNESLGINSSFDIKKMIINIIYGNGAFNSLKQNSALWFLPAIFSMNIFFYFFQKIKDSNTLTILLKSLFLFLINIFTCLYLKITFPFGINTVLNLSLLFYIGILLKQTQIEKYKFKILNFVMLITGVFAFYFNDVVTCIDYSYGNYCLMLISSFSFSYIILNLSLHINKNRLLEYIGKNTMGILIFHKILIVLFQTKLGVISELLISSDLTIEIIMSLIIVILTIILSLIATEICRKILPLSIGENKKKICESK